jgi:hypothetical protein
VNAEATGRGARGAGRGEMRGWPPGTPGLPLPRVRTCPRPAPRDPRPALVALVALLAAGCSWFTDFKDQPKMEPWESAGDSVPPRGNPQSSVPVEGALVPGFLVSR